MNTALPATKTTAKTSDELAIGDIVKFGKDDFRTIADLEDKGYTTWIIWDQATIPSRAYWWTDVAARKSWRVAV